MALANPQPSGVYSLRFYQTGSATSSYSDNQWLFLTPVNNQITAEVITTIPNTDAVSLGPFSFSLLNSRLTHDAITVHWTESSVAKSATLAYSYANTPSRGSTIISGTNAANVASAKFEPDAGTVIITFATGHPPDANSITVDYKIRQVQGWSKGIRVTAVTANVTISFDGTNDHGIVLSGTSAEYFDRYEGGIAVKGAGATFYVEVW